MRNLAAEPVILALLGPRPRRVAHALALTRIGLWPTTQSDGVGTLVGPVFAAQHSTCVCPCQRFPSTLAGTTLHYSAANRSVRRCPLASPDRTANSSAF